MFGQLAAGPHARAAHVDDNFEALWRHAHPAFGQFAPFFFAQEIAFARRAVDEDAFQPVAYEQGSVRFDGSVVYVSAFVQRSKWGINEPDNLFHVCYFLNLCIVKLHSAMSAATFTFPISLRMRPVPTRGMWASSGKAMKKSPGRNVAHDVGRSA